MGSVVLSVVLWFSVRHFGCPTVRSFSLCDFELGRSCLLLFTKTLLVVPPSVTDHQGLPESYVTVPAVALNTSSVSVPACSTTPLHGNVSLDGAIQQEGR